MGKLSGLEPRRVFEYFEEISAIPRGSGHMEKIADYCATFAEAHSLRYVRDEANNVVIFKDGTVGYEASEPIILQGHLDMVWQKDETCGIDLEKDGIDIACDGEYVTAKGTTLGADNGIAVATIMAILASDEIPHPPIEAVFTTDEEIGMIGASKLSTDVLRGKKMINLDSEDPGVLTVSCAGGSDFKMTIPLTRAKMHGKRIALKLEGLMGGHSGIEIDSGRVNANILAGRVLNKAKTLSEFEIMSINGGTKNNAIPNLCEVEIVTEDSDRLIPTLNECLEEIKTEIAEREPNFEYSVQSSAEGEYEVIASPDCEKIIFALLLAPNGVCEMSASIENLVETSLNLGILKTQGGEMTLSFALRSNKASALRALEEKLFTYARCIPCSVETGGHYMPWEFKKDSDLQKLCIDTYRELYGYEPTVAAIHAGLECATFSGKIKELDCIAIGPEILGAHTTKERLNIKSVKKVSDLVLKILEKCK